MKTESHSRNETHINKTIADNPWLAPPSLCRERKGLLLPTNNGSGQLILSPSNSSALPFHNITMKISQAPGNKFDLSVDLRKDTGKFCESSVSPVPWL